MTNTESGSERGSLIPDFASEKEKKRFFSSLPDTDRIRIFHEILRKSSHTVFLSGPGISTSCGVSNIRAVREFRQPDGKKVRKYDTEYVLSTECLSKEPELFYTFFRKEMDVRSAAPGITHMKIAEMEKAGVLGGVITVNTDGLHQKAGSRHVEELCGNANVCRCETCRVSYSSDLIFDSTSAVPVCPVCGRMLRPTITLYGEMLPEEELFSARHMIDEADCLITAGCSFKSDVTRSLAARFRGKFLIIINPGKTRMDPKADLLFHAGADRIMRQIEVDRLTGKEKTR